MCICQSCLCYLRKSHQICPAATPVTHTKLIAATWNYSPLFPHGMSAGTGKCHQSHGHETPWRDPPGGRTSKTRPHSLRSAKQCQLLYCLDQNMHLLSQKKGPMYKICLCLLVPECVNITFSVTEIPVYARVMTMVITWHVVYLYSN